MLELVGQAPLSAMVVFTSATFPAVAARFIEPIPSAAGSSAPFVALELS